MKLAAAFRRPLGGPSFCPLWGTKRAEWNDGVSNPLKSIAKLATHRKLPANYGLWEGFVIRTPLRGGK